VEPGLLLLRQPSPIPQCCHAVLKSQLHSSASTIILEFTITIGRPLHERGDKSKMRALIVRMTLLSVMMMMTIIHTSSAFSTSLACGKTSRGESSTRVHVRTSPEDGITVSRRDWFGSVAAVGAVIFAPYQAAFAEEQAAVAPVVMRDFLDPKGLFSIRIPKSYFALRRTAKGDLPDEKTGQGRRGSSIFTAGDMGKAELIAIER
jgi:hypothetical protein